MVIPSSEPAAACIRSGFSRSSIRPVWWVLRMAWKNSRACLNPRFSVSFSKAGLTSTFGTSAAVCGGGVGCESFIHSVYFFWLSAFASCRFTTASRLSISSTCALISSSRFASSSVSFFSSSPRMAACSMTSSSRSAISLCLRVATCSYLLALGKCQATSANASTSTK